LIESFLTSDPTLQQVVSNTWTTGLRDTQTIGKNKLQWGIGAFSTINKNDIITVFSNVAGRGVFQNSGNTLRQGIEANISYETPRWFFYANYAFIDATFLDALTLSSLSPFATTCPGTTPADDLNCVFVRPGDNLPGIPQNRFKLGADYWITPKWKFGGDLVAASGQFFFGDESNQDKQVGGYTRVDLHTSYDVTPKIQFFGLINNLFNQHYGLFGGYTNLDDANIASIGNPSTGPNFFTSPRTIVPAAPFVAYAGAKIKLW
jgi:outer membrane receptor protein involved in Fe transport